jgi:DNA-binding CsgD family transcriptional regulator
LPAEAPAVSAQPRPLEGPDRAGGRLITRGADLVVLAEELYLRLFILALAFVLVSGALSVWFGIGSAAPLGVTLPFSLAVMVFALGGLLRPRQLYGWLRYSRPRQLAPAVISALAMVPTGPDSPLWWPALALVILVTSISSLRLSLLAAVLNAAGYVAGTVVGGEAIIRGGEAGILAGAVGFVAYTLVGSFVCQAFAGFVLGFGRLEDETSPGEPRRVSSVVLDDHAATPLRSPAPLHSSAPLHPSAPRHPPAPLHSSAPLRPTVTAPALGSPLTPRQLQVALLIRDGLNQSEAAASLGISRRQVERLLGEARERAGASTTSHLVAMLVHAGLAP